MSPLDPRPEVSMLIARVAGAIAAIALSDLHRLILQNFSGRRRDEFGLTKVRSTQAHSGL
jgi:hypothetical protein